MLMLLAALLSLNAKAAPFDDFKFQTPGRVDLSLGMQYYKPDANFDKTGNSYTRLPSGYSYQLMNVDFGARARLAPRWHLYGSGQFAQANADNLVNGVSQARSKSGLSQLQLGTDFIMMAGGIMLIPDFTFTMPMVKTERTSADAAIGEGVMEMTGRMVARIERRSWRFGGFLGLNYRDGGRSMLVPYGFLTEFSFGKWNLGADLRGYQSITNDKETSAESTFDASYFCVANGCAKRFAALNPTILQSNLWVRANFNPQFGIFAGGTFDITGSNTTHGVAFMGGLIYRFSSGRATGAAPRPEFEEFLDDGIDQSAFQGGRSMTPSKKGGPPRPTLQDELNKTEMQIETNPVRDED